MKKAILIFAVTFCSIAAMSQTKPDSAKQSGKVDTTIQVVMSLDQFKALLYGIDSNIDSKKASKDIIQFLQQSARIMEAEKPKAVPKADRPPGK